MYIIILILLSLFIIHYVTCGILGTYISIKFYHDIPGPKAINAANGTTDWLCIHGASIDARLWQGFIDSSKATSKITAISIGNHEQLLNLVKPDASSGQDISAFLENTNVNHGIIAHSSGALWLASAYDQDATPWNSNWRIILLTPNFGHNVQVGNSFFKKLIAHVSINYLFWLLPDPAVAILHGSACTGSADHKKCIDTYYAGRRVRLYSWNYYRRLINYMRDINTQQHLTKFLQDFASRITIVNATNDAVIDHEKTLEVARQFNIRVIAIEDSHVGVINQPDKWFHND